MILLVLFSKTYKVNNQLNIFEILRKHNFLHNCNIPILMHLIWIKITIDRA